MQGDLPDALSIRVLQAPISWMLPVNKHTPFRPPFRVAVDVMGPSAPQESVSLLPQLVSEGEIHNSAFCRSSVASMFMPHQSRQAVSEIQKFQHIDSILCLHCSRLLLSPL